jgi:hypothetical protein
MSNRPSPRLTEALAALDAARGNREAPRELDLFGPPANVDPVIRAIECVAVHAVYRAEVTS